MRVPNIGQHYRLGPSSCSRWIHCPGSAREGAPETDTVHTRRGNHLHDVVEFNLSEGVPNFESGMDYAHVEACIAFANSIEGEKFFEQTFLSDVIEDYGGTIDLCSILPDRYVLADWKFGKTVVAVEQNKQLLSYASLVREEFGPKDLYECYIVQPQVYDEPQRTTYTDAEVLSHWEKVKDASTSQKRVAGDHCKYCPWKQTCVEFRDWTLKR